jgi:ankyrin repeat protein
VHLFIGISWTDPSDLGSRLGTAIQAASLGGHLSIVRELIDCGADVNIQGENPVLLHQVPASHHSVQGGLYGTALHAACGRGSLEIVRLLFECHADPNIQGNK